MAVADESPNPSDMERLELRFAPEALDPIIGDV
jgi:hypothetical protein